MANDPILKAINTVIDESNKLIEKLKRPDPDIETEKKKMKLLSKELEDLNKQYTSSLKEEKEKTQTENLENKIKNDSAKPDNTSLEDKIKKPTIKPEEKTQTTPQIKPEEKTIKETNKIIKEINSKENPFKLAKTIMLSQYLSKQQGEETKKVLSKLLIQNGYVESTIKTKPTGYLEAIGEIETPLNEQSIMLIAYEMAEKTIKTINSKGLRTKKVEEYLTNIKKQTTPEAYALIAMQAAPDYGINIEEIEKGKNIGPIEEIIMTLLLKQESKAFGLDNSKILLDEMLKEDLNKKAYNQLVKIPNDYATAKITSKTAVKA